MSDHIHLTQEGQKLMGKSIAPIMAEIEAEERRARLRLLRRRIAIFCLLIGVPAAACALFVAISMTRYAHMMGFVLFCGVQLAVVGWILWDLAGKIANLRD